MNTANTALKPYVALGKRELWEHRSFWLVQLVVAGLLTLVFIGFAITLIYAHYNGFVSVDPSGLRGSGGAQTFMKLIMASTGPFNVVLIFLVSFYLIDTLTADRRDRSILFWRSLPVSDTATVLSKLFTAMVTAPAIMLVVAIAFLIVSGIIWGIAFLVIGTNPFLLFHPLSAILALLTLTWALVAQSLWLLPFYGWFMLCSAWAKRMAWGWVILIPLGIMALEGIVFQTSYFGGMIGRHIAGLADLLVGRGGIVIRADSHAIMPVHHAQVMTLGSVTEFMFRPEMLIGLIIGSVFVAGAVWLRHNRNEI